MKNFLFKKELVFLLIAILLGLIVLISSFFLNPGPKTPLSSTEPAQRSSFPISSSDISILNAEPDPQTFLSLGQIQTFKFTFSKPVKINDIRIDLEKLNILGDDGYQKTKVNYSFSPDGRILSLITEEPILPYNNYRTRIIDNSANLVIFENTYLTMEPKPSPVVSNNPDLLQYLPFDTTNFRIVYVPDKNIYVFNFKPDLDSPIELTEQYEKAKQDALVFIREKGIDPNSLAIEYRYK